MANLVSVALRLRFVFVIDAVETTIEIILIFTPCDASHHVNAITVLAPGFDAGRKICVNAVNNGDIGTQISLRRPCFAGLKTSAFENLIGIR